MSQLLRVTTLMRADLDQGLEQRGLTQARAHLLWELGAHQPVTQRVLAELLRVTPRNITALLDALEASGHVMRQPHPTDRRAVLVSLTPSGAEVVERLQHEMAELADLLFATASPADLDAFVRVTGGAAAQLASLAKAAR
ncbi:MAG: MarR family winged helix-turn-helix transcriptional regulator [Devosia sp.]